MFLKIIIKNFLQLSIHYFWFGRGPKPELAIKCIESWKKYCPDWEIIECNEDNYDVNRCEYMKEAYAQGKYAFASDYARFDILYRFGGVYLDTDVELIKKIPDGFLEDQGFTGLESNNKIASGLVFAVKKGNPIVKEILEMYQKEHFTEKNGKINLDTDMVEKSTLLTKAINKNKKLFGNGEDIQIITFGKVQKKLPFTVDVYGAADLVSKKLKIDLPCSVYKINRSTGKLVKNMGVYTMDDGVVTFSVDDTQYAYVIEESPLVVEKTKGKYEILSDSGFEMTLADLKAKTKGTVRLVVNDEDSTLLINSADIQASTATATGKLLLQVEKQDATKYKNGSKTLDAKTNIVLDTGDLGTLGCTTTIYLETEMKKKSITVWGLDSKGAVVNLGKAKTDANGILKITAKAATLKRWANRK